MLYGDYHTHSNYSKDGKGRLLWKGKLYRLDAEQNKKFREMLLKDLEGEE